MRCMCYESLINVVCVAYLAIRYAMLSSIDLVSAIACILLQQNCMQIEFPGRLDVEGQRYGPAQAKVRLTSECDRRKALVRMWEKPLFVSFRVPPVSE